MRVGGLKTHTRKEPNWWEGLKTCTIDQPRSFVKGLSSSILDRTRKMVNYA